MTRRGVVLRATGMLGAISILVFGVTYALTTFQSELTDVTFSAIGNSLKVAADCTNFGAVDSTALSIVGLNEGAGYVGGNAKTFCLRDSDATHPMSVTVTADLAGVVSSGSLDPSKVDVQFVDSSNGNAVTNTTLQALEAGQVNLAGANGGSHLAADGGTDTFTVNIKVNNGAVLSTPAEIAHLGLVFTGTLH